MDLSKYGFRPGFDLNDTIVKQEYITFNGAEYWVSTVDLGLNHSFGDGPPLYFETMIFPKGTYNDMYCRRYGHKEIALEKHELLASRPNTPKPMEGRILNLLERITQLEHQLSTHQQYIEYLIKHIRQLEDELYGPSTSKTHRENRLPNSGTQSTNIPN